jgi:hypothetical protein
VIEGRDDFDVAATGEWEHEVPRPERGVAAPVDEHGTEV